MKFTNNICLKVRDESFESSIDVLDFVLCMNEMIKEKKDKKQIYIINEAERVFPFPATLFRFVE